MRFTKMHGLGNDYIYVDGSKEHIETAAKPDLVRQLSDRHTGIGGDGVIFINPSDEADFEMEMYNADGSRSEMCGNGIRCVGKYVYDHGLTDKTKLEIISAGKIKYLDLTVNDGKVVTVRVDMGAPEIIGPPVTVSANGVRYELMRVSMGNPHAVTFVDDVKSADVHSAGPIIETDSQFPAKTNVEFVHVVDRKTVDMRVWERGTGETQACGTGACGTAVSCIMSGFTDGRVEVRLPGGSLMIEWDGKPDSHVFMTGPATEVFEGEI